MHWRSTGLLSSMHFRSTGSWLTCTSVIRGDQYMLLWLYNLSDVLTDQLLPPDKRILWISGILFFGLFLELLGSEFFQKYKPGTAAPPPHVVEMLIIELRGTVLSLSYYILLFILCKISEATDGLEGVTDDKDNWKQGVLTHQASWHKFKTCDGWL